MIRINYLTVKKAALLYMLLPTAIFLYGWLKWYYAIFAISCLFVAFIYIANCDKKSKKNNVMYISKEMLIAILICSLLWCFLAGIGGFYYQSDDHNLRNAIFRDLINYDWPVVYDKKYALVYYIGQWLIPALFGKMFLNISESVAWSIGNIALYIWSMLGIFLFILLIYFAIGKNTNKNIISGKIFIICIIILIFFSGMDIIGIVLQCITNRKLILIDHIESWSGFWEYSSITTCLFWVYNQVIVAWIAILLYLNEEELSIYALIGCMTLPFSPIPFLGMIPYFILNVIKKVIIQFKSKEYKKVIKEIFSIPNLAVLGILPIIIIYYSSNLTVNNDGFGVSNGFIERGIIKSIIIIILFIILEFGAYALLLWKDNKRNMNYYISVISLMLIPFFRLGSSSDFTMRTSIPSLSVLAVLVLCLIVKIYDNRKINTKSNLIGKLLVFTLLIGSITPIFEYARACYRVLEAGKLNVVADSVITLADKELEYISNFVCCDPNDKVFFKYLAK